MTSHVFIQKMHYSLTSCQLYFLVPLSSFLAHLLAKYIYDLVPKGAHARGYALQLKITHCWKLFLFKMLSCVCAWMNEYIVQIISATRLWLISRYIHHTLKKVVKNDWQKQTSMYRVIFVTLLTNKLQAHGVTITDLYAENIILYG